MSVKVTNFEVSTGKIFEAVELEKVIVGACLIEPACCFDVLQLLKAKHFYDPKTKVVFQVIEKLVRTSVPVNIMTVTQELKKADLLDYVGGPHIVSKYTDRVASSNDVEIHCRYVIEQWIQRELIAISQRIIFQSKEPDPIGNLQVAFNEINQLFDPLNAKARKTIKQVATELIFSIQNKSLTKNLVTPFPSVNEKLIQLEPGNLYIIAARPGIGKTALLLQIMSNIALNYSAALFSLEMSADQLVGRLISAATEIDSSLIKKNKLTQMEKDLINEMIATMTDNLIIDDTPGLPMNKLRLKAITLKAKHDIEIIGVDYLQLMDPDDKSKYSNRETDISNISRGLKKLAKELEIPIIALSQLSRETEKRKTGRPQLSDLRESGAIEQDADSVIFLYQPTKYLSRNEVAEGTVENETEIIIAKNRGGKTGSAYLQFLPEYTKFREIPESSAGSTEENQDINF